MGIDPVSLRRALHRIPELGFEEFDTQQMVRHALETFGGVSTIAKTGLSLELGPKDAERTLLLRADMDALPIHEEAPVPFASERPGMMHACGHDAHMAALVVAGERLATLHQGPHRLRLLFQPAEEGLGGAQACIEAGALDGVDAAFGIHIWNELPVGTVAVPRGGVMAGVVEFEVTIVGRGGHGALPHRTADPIVAGAQLVSSLQQIVSRRASPFEPAVVSVGAFNAGDAFNVIPDQATLLGTVRTFSEVQEQAVERDLRQIAHGIGLATGTELSVRWQRYAGPTVNDDHMVEVVRRAAHTVAGIDCVLTDYRTMAGEDFGDIARLLPACFVLLGSAPSDGSPAEPHHSPRFMIDEAVLDLAVDLHLSVSAEWGRQGQS